MTTSDRLYALLPAQHRIRDAAQGYPLRALLAVIETELVAIESDIDGLYDDAFIETCSEQIVPYIGDLLGVRTPFTIDGATVSARAYVANTIAYRRWKGTAAVLEALAADVLGWPARVVEYFRLIAATQHLQHVRMDRLATAPIRDADAMDLLATPFSKVARTAEVRRIDTRDGKYNLPNVGLFVWRLGAFRVKGAIAGTRATLQPNYFTFDPSGLDTPLFHTAEEEGSLQHIAEEWNVPGPLRRRALYDELTAGATATAHWFGADPVLAVTAVRADGTSKAYASTEIDIMNLAAPLHGARWRRPAAGRVAIDPELGRIAFPESDQLARVAVDYSYAAPGEVGAGSYDRQDVVRTLAADQVFVVSQGRHTLGQAIDAWNHWAASVVPDGATHTGVIAIADSATHDLGSKVLSVPAGVRLVLVAASQSAGTTTLEASGLRPYVRGRLVIHGAGASSDEGTGQVLVDGLWIEEGIAIAPGFLASLAIGHATLGPGGTGLAVHATGALTNGKLAVTMDRSIAGRVTLASDETTLAVTDGLVQSIDAVDTDVTLGGVTVLGDATVRTLEASSCIFAARVHAERRQAGCVRYSYVSLRSRTPRRYRCQPDLVVSAAAGLVEKKRAAQAIVPRFTSTTWGDPAYGQLAAACPDEIETGADDGAEMGAYHHLMAPQREQNLRAALDEYLRFGLTAGIFYVT